MPNQWEETTWGEAIELKYGKAIRGYQDANEAYPVFGTNGQVGTHSQLLAEGPGVILGRKGAYRGVHYSKQPFFVIDTAYYVAPKQEMDMRWLYYAMQHYKLGQIDDGSPIPSTTRAAVYSSEFTRPPIGEQRDIAACLGSLDDKIELNRRMNETLEEMARALFRDLFVDFGPTRRQIEGVTDPAAIMGQAFPPEKAATLAPLFPAKLGDDGLPEGWSKKIVSEQIHVLTGQAFKSKDYVDQGVFVLRTKNFGKNNVASRLADDVFLPENYLEKYHKFIVQPFDYHLVMVGASLGKRGLVYPHMLPALRNQNMWCFRARSGSKVTQVFVKYLTDFLVDRSIGLASGSARDFFRKGDFEKQKFAFGTIKIQNAFHSLCQVLLEKMAANEHENQTLAEMRDLLLPKLMSGEIRLKDVGVVQ